jgi:glycosyltransferase involved in cell wall biosynthesis
VAQRIIGALAHLGIEARELIRPEMYSATVAFQSLGEFRKGNVHLIFKPIEEIRILRGAYNIACILWEFDQLNDRARTANPCSNYVRMLNTVDEVWCYCRFTRDVVQRYFSNVRLVPVPFQAPGRTERETAALPRELRPIPALRVAEKRFGTLGGFLERIPRPDFVALTVFNPWDWRKNIGNMLNAFALFQRDKPGAVLILKWIVDNNTHRLEDSLTLLDRYCNDDALGSNILVITSDLPEQALAQLYQFAEFYLCASHCEGLGMPLLEAMGQGAIPITVNNTAMADYINVKNAFIVPSKRELARQESNISRNPNLTWYTADVTPIALALERAFRASPEARREKRRAAIATLRTDYAIENSASFLVHRLRALGMQATVPAEAGT